MDCSEQYVKSTLDFNQLEGSLRTSLFHGSSLGLLSPDKFGVVVIEKGDFRSTSSTVSQLTSN